MNNLKMITLALHYYPEKHGHLPPACIADKDGKPMHSWRVLLLETTDEELFKRYRFDEPWDGPNNRKLASLMPAFYACPNEHDVRNTPSVLTSYVALTGPGTAFPGDRSTKFEDMVDGLDKTILIVETKDSGIHWMEPRDLAVSNFLFPPDPSRHPALSSNDPGGPHLAFGDGHWERVKHPIRLPRAVFGAAAPNR